MQSGSSKSEKGAHHAENATALESSQAQSATSTSSGVIDRQKPNLEVVVDHNIEKAMRVLKRKLIREGVFKELKARRYYEKPCDKRKRKTKESHKRTRKEEARQRKFASGLM